MTDTKSLSASAWQANESNTESSATSLQLTILLLQSFVTAEGTSASLVELLLMVVVAYLDFTPSSSRPPFEVDDNLLAIRVLVWLLVLACVVCVIMDEGLLVKTP